MVFGKNIYTKFLSRIITNIPPYFRYYMYFHRIMTAIVFMFIFATIEFICATIAWKGFGEILWHKLYQLFIDHEQPALQQQEVAAITNEKDEEELSSNGEQSASAAASERSN